MILPRQAPERVVSPKVTWKCQETKIKVSRYPVRVFFFPPFSLLSFFPSTAVPLSAISISIRVLN